MRHRHLKFGPDRPGDKVRCNYQGRSGGDDSTTISKQRKT
jgi:hypothetical protein